MASKVVQMVPTDEHPVPFDESPDVPANYKEEMEVAAATAELLDSLRDQNNTSDQLENAQRLLKEAVEAKDKGGSQAASKALTNPAVASSISLFLREYASHAAIDYAAIRQSSVARLADHIMDPDPKISLKALELMGKVSDVGLFTQKTEVNINYNDPNALERAIKERVSRLLKAQTDDLRPLSQELDEELALGKVEDAEFTEVPDGEGGDLADWVEQRRMELEEAEKQEKIGPEDR